MRAVSLQPISIPMILLFVQLFKDERLDFIFYSLLAWIHVSTCSLCFLAISTLPDEFNQSFNKISHTKYLSCVMSSTQRSPVHLTPDRSDQWQWSTSTSRFRRKIVAHPSNGPVHPFSTWSSIPRRFAESGWELAWETCWQKKAWRWNGQPKEPVSRVTSDAGKVSTVSTSRGRSISILCDLPFDGIDWEGWSTMTSWAILEEQHFQLNPALILSWWAIWFPAALDLFLFFRTHLPWWMNVDNVEVRWPLQHEV